MKKKFENIERRGLPGGPNEVFSYVTGVFSTEGYKSDSPDKNNLVNLIASGSITMENVEFPVFGMDNLGNSKMMMPGNNYEFPGDMVLEIPMAQKGGSVSWKWKGKSYSGTLIPSMENEKNRYARTKNGKIKTLPKKQLAGQITNDILLRQVVAESSLDPNAVSPAGARGLAQIMPNTETELKRLKFVDDNFNPLDPSQAKSAQEAYMNYLSEKAYLAKGSPEVQLAKVLYAYNRGPTAAKRNLTKLKNSYDIYNSLDWLEGINSESRNYINKILGKDEKFSKQYENILLDSSKADIIKMYKQFGGDVDLKKIYKNFIDGTYDGTGNEKKAKDIFDKLNRMYYREAKSAGMSIPNYVMTYVINNS